MNKAVSNLIYALGVFFVYAGLIFIMNKLSNKMPVADNFLGIYSQKDLLMGLGISVFLTYMHIRKQVKK